MVVVAYGPGILSIPGAYVLTLVILVNLSLTHKSFCLMDRGATAPPERKLWDLEEKAQVRGLQTKKRNIGL